MTVCDNERSLAVIYGEKLNKNRKNPKVIFIFVREKGVVDKFTQTQMIDIEPNKWYVCYQN